MSLLIAAGWALLGAAVGLGINAFSGWQAQVEDAELRRVGEEGLELGQQPWENVLAPALAALLFGIFAWSVGPHRLLLIDSVYVAILVQVLAFDLKHRYILDTVMFPSWVVAIALAFVTPWSPGAWPAADWRTAIVAGLIAGAAFFLLYLLGTRLFGPAGLGFGDVKLAVFIGLCTGLSDLRMVHALLAGVYIGGAAAVVLLLSRRARLRQAVPYAPFLVAGTLLTLLIQKP